MLSVEEASLVVWAIATHSFAAWVVRPCYPAVQGRPHEAIDFDVTPLAAQASLQRQSLSLEIRVIVE